VISALALGLLTLSHPTLALRVGLSRSCHERTRAVQQATQPLNDFIGAQEQLKSAVGCRSALAGLEIDDELELDRALDR
jgi:hypothetical protein